MDLSDKEKEIIYLDYFNNYLTIEKFAIDNCITKNKAEGVITRGKSLNNKKGV